MVAENIGKLDNFDQTVRMWVWEEMIDGRPLTSFINEEHENVRYLPGIRLPANVLAIPNLLDAIRDCTLLVFVIPHQVQIFKFHVFVVYEWCAEAAQGTNCTGL